MWISEVLDTYPIFQFFEKSLNDDLNIIFNEFKAVDRIFSKLCLRLWVYPVFFFVIIYSFMHLISSK